MSKPVSFVDHPSIVGKTFYWPSAASMRYQLAKAFTEVRSRKLRYDKKNNKLRNPQWLLPQLKWNRGTPTTIGIPFNDKTDCVLEMEKNEQHAFIGSESSAWLPMTCRTRESITRFFLIMEVADYYYYCCFYQGGGKDW